MLGKMLAQVGSTRSDFFTAYVKIAGYKATQFNLGPVETRNFMVVFDRSTVSVNAGTITPAQVIGILEMD